MKTWMNWTLSIALGLLWFAPAIAAVADILLWFFLPNPHYIINWTLMRVIFTTFWTLIPFMIVVVVYG